MSVFFLSDAGGSVYKQAKRYRTGRMIFRAHYFVNISS